MSAPRSAPRFSSQVQLLGQGPRLVGRLGGGLDGGLGGKLRVGVGLKKGLQRELYTTLVACCQAQVRSGPGPGIAQI